MSNVLNVKRVSRFAMLSIALTLSLAACQKDSLIPESQEVTGLSASDRAAGTIVDIAVSNPDFSTLVAAVLKTGQAGLLSKSSLNATVFAPTNAAFAQLPYPFDNAQNINDITDPKLIKTLRDVLRFHIAPGKRTAADLPNGSYQTYKNAITPNDNRIYVSRSVADEVFINGTSKVIAADVQASNGIIHVINKVLFFPTQDLAQIAISNGNFTALVAALQKTGLTNAVMSPVNNFTVFAPVDAAFAKLPAPLNNAANISGITDQGTIDLLRTVLLYHVVNGRVFAPDLREGLQAPTLSGSTLGFSLSNGATVTGSGNTTPSKIVLTDLLARNGVIHVIDQVLLP